MKNKSLVYAKIIYAVWLVYIFISNIYIYTYIFDMKFNRRYEIDKDTLAHTHNTC